jgi:hypothetical protein
MAAGFEKHQKRTRRAEFLAQMEVVVPWPELVAEIEPSYPKAGNGRPPVGLERMLRMYFLQQWFNSRTRLWKRRCTTRWRCVISKIVLGKVDQYSESTRDLGA